MGRELKKKLMMVLGAGALVLGASSAARADETIVAKVPFDFIVNNVRMPAGKYVITRLSEQPILSIVSADRKHHAFVLTNLVTTTLFASTPELVFDTFGTNHFLARVMGDDAEGREIPLTPAVMKRETDRADRVIVAATTQ
jgi:hypothetical protein